MDSGSELEVETPQLLGRRQILTEFLEESPYDFITYLERATCHSELGYPDLAAGDAYRALLLIDEVRDEGFEYHYRALEALESRCEGRVPAILPELRAGDITKTMKALSLNNIAQDSALSEILDRASLQCYRCLSTSLLLCGCLKSSYGFCLRGLGIVPEDEDLLFKKEHIRSVARRKLSLKDDEIDINDLKDQGLVRREIYPWNEHEPDRFSQETLDFLNTELRAVASKCEVRVTELPTLYEVNGIGAIVGATNKQLGLFADTDITSGETILDEYSALTANNRLKESLCDSCSGVLPPLDANTTVVGCPDCDDTMFCNELCLERSADYHPAVCDKDIDTIAKDPDPKETPNALYLLLLARALAMAETKEVHPLELKEVKYIWGDFLPSAANAVPVGPDTPSPPVWTLPFSFASNISGPLHVLEKMDIDIFASVERYDLWIFNSLYAKFRGTASARVNLRDGRPEVAAVHPLWCLANHDCNPNVQWEWAGQMRLWCREKRCDGTKGGIKEGQEILNHYCDIELKVQDRREWAKGSLGGWCMCERCKREAQEEATNGIHAEEHKRETIKASLDG
ncbi:hypothetical protein BJ878DRAFT_528842 [Calycina marina]|uniref:SET domain-containing protein n=1 Tax=Calycina marina TaxID=1763456 RepID=A0A9P7YU59_9HELO|nr:hypothetical protein BJ878DRAFT_528842 [Calycina marina]